MVYSDGCWDAVPERKRVWVTVHEPSSTASEWAKGRESPECMWPAATDAMRVPARERSRRGVGS